jgi:indolepyruvate ferredoxin oxidoreductase
MLQQVRAAVGAEPHAAAVDATALATALLGDAIYANPFVLGFAWQKGWIPLAYETLVRAIELNGVALDANKRAFEWGRAAAHDPEAVRRAAGGAAQVIELKRAPTLEEIVARRAEFLTGYQNAAYAQRYRDLVSRVRRVESDRLQSTKLAEAVARYYFKLLAIKDEYEVARLHSDPAFREKIAAMFEGGYRLGFHLAPPLLAKADPLTGRPRKMRLGPWVMTAFGVLAKLKVLRGTVFDVFGRTEERRTERLLIAEYEQLVDEVLGALAADNHAAAVELAGIPEEIRGYGHVKARHLERARARQAELLARFRGRADAQVIRMPAKAA